MAHVQQNGIPESLEAPPTAEEEYPMEDTSSAPAGGEQPIVERFSPQDMHKDQSKWLNCCCSLANSLTKVSHLPTNAFG